MKIIDILIVAAVSIEVIGVYSGTQLISIRVAKTKALTIPVIL